MTKPTCKVTLSHGFGEFIGGSDPWDTFSSDQPIIDVVEKFATVLPEIASSSNGTREFLCPQVILDFETEDFDYGVARTALGKYLEERNVDLDQRERDEADHYQFLKYALLQKFNAIRYFHGGDMGTRKAIVFSDDCIS